MDEAAVTRYVTAAFDQVHAFETVKPLLAEVYDLAASKHAQRQAAEWRRSDREE